MPTTLATASSFFTARAEVRDESPQLTTLCAGFEAGEWRREAFANYLFEYLLEFALQWSQLQTLDSPTAARMIQEAARRVYESAERERCGEFGELLLHAVLRSHFNSEPTVAKLFCQVGEERAVRGFDCVHIVTPEGPDEAQLWLGEARFYSDVAEGLQSGITSLAELSQSSRLTNEFVLIRGATDGEWPYAAQLKALSDGKTLDEVFDRVCLPLLVTYDSVAVNEHSEAGSDYEQALQEESEAIYSHFREHAQLPDGLAAHLILVPLKSKEELAAALRERLKDLRTT